MFLRPTRLLCLVIFQLGVTLGVVDAGETAVEDKSWSIGDLEKRLVEIDTELEQLASLSLRSGVGAIGYRSRAYDECDRQEWIKIDLINEQTIDQVILVPSIWRDTKTGFRADGFPVEFRIIAGTAQDTEGTVVATYGEKDQLLPRIAPLVIPCKGVSASWIRVEATELSPRAWDGKYILQLFEILVFHNEENVALRKHVTTSSPDQNEGEARDRRYLVDGFVPYLMDAAHGEQSVAFVSQVGAGEQPVLIMDLGESLPLNRIHLHATDISDTVPQSVSNDFGMPRWLIVEGSTEPDFSDVFGLIEFRMNSVYDTGPIVMRNFQETECRYVRLTALEPFFNSTDGGTGTQIGFAEIEVFANGKNVAVGINVHGEFDVGSPGRSYRALTDGLNLCGDILPIRGWLGELAKRHELEVERPRIVAALDQRYTKQKTNLNRMGWLAALLAAGIIFTILIQRLIRMRQVSHIRLRLAADLHDELGANIHTIGLLSDLAAETTNDPEELATLHRRIRSETERSGMAVRNCTNMLEAVGLYTDLKEDMLRTSRRIMAKLDHDIEITGENHLNRLKSRARVDLFLFYKECLINISRHAGGDRFKTRLTAGKQQVLLTISDNGRGLDEAEDDIPKSLKRRAKLLRAHVSVESPASGGTCIKLVLPTRMWGYKPNKNHE